MPSLLDYRSLVEGPKQTRSSESIYDCGCSICDFARLKLESAVKHAKEHSNPVGAPIKKPKSEPPAVIKVCTECLSEIGPGKPHQCIRTVKRENISAFVRGTSEKSIAAVTVFALKEIAQQQGVGVRGGKVLLSSGSKVLPVVVGSKYSPIKI